MPQAKSKLRLLSTGSGPFTAAVPQSLLASFGPAKFTEADQAANPDRPMTRLIKDVLPSGTWKAGRDFWNVTNKELGALLANFRLAKSRGHSVNIGKTHGDLNFYPPLIHPDDLLQPVDEAAVHDGKLWISTYVTPEQAKYLSNPARKVSIGAGPFTDGKGFTYPGNFMFHVAVTDNPVVLGQGPWMALANATSTEGKSMDFQAMVDLWKRAFALLGLTFPENVDENTLMTVVDALLQSQEGNADAGGGADPAADPAADLAADPAAAGGGAGAGLTMNLSRLAPAAREVVKSIVSEVRGEMKLLSAALAELKSEKAAQQKQQYEAKLLSLTIGGHITAKKKAELAALGAENGYNLKLLSPFDDIQMVPKGSAAKILSNSQPPEVPGGGEQRTPEQEKADREAAKARLLGKQPQAAK